MGLYQKHGDHRSDHKILFSMQHMPLSSAYLCGDCHCVGNCAERCPACASTALLGLAGILNREQSMEATQVNYELMVHRGKASLAA